MDGATREKEISETQKTYSLFGKSLASIGLRDILQMLNSKEDGFLCMSGL